MNSQLQQMQATKVGTNPVAGVDPVKLFVSGHLNFQEYAKAEPFDLVVPVFIKAPAAAGQTVAPLYTESENERELLIVGAISDLYDPDEVQQEASPFDFTPALPVWFTGTPIRRVPPRLKVKLTSNRIDRALSNAPLPLQFIFGNTRQQVTSFWQRPLALTPGSQLQIEMSIVTSPTWVPPTGGTPAITPIPQSIQGDLVFKCIRLR